MCVADEYTLHFAKTTRQTHAIVWHAEKHEECGEQDQFGNGLVLRLHDLLAVTYLTKWNLRYPPFEYSIWNALIVLA